jgi:hypothetical protein
MHRIMVQPLHGGVRLTAIFDSCHSGTALDLPYIYSTQGILKEPNLAKEAGQGLLGAISAYGRGDLGGVASNVFGFLKKATNGDDAYNRTMATKTSPADVVMLSGSKDDQTSFVYPISLSIIPFRVYLQSAYYVDHIKSSPLPRGYICVLEGNMANHPPSIGPTRLSLRKLPAPCPGPSSPP